MQRLGVRPGLVPAAAAAGGWPRRGGRAVRGAPGTLCSPACCALPTHPDRARSGVPNVTISTYILLSPACWQAHMRPLPLPPTLIAQGGCVGHIKDRPLTYNTSMQTIPTAPNPKPAFCQVDTAEAAKIMAWRTPAGDGGSGEGAGAGRPSGGHIPGHLLNATVLRLHGHPLHVRAPTPGVLTTNVRPGSKLFRQPCACTSSHSVCAGCSSAGHPKQSF